MQTTLNLIRAQSPCRIGWQTLLTHLGKTAADDEPLHLRTVLEANDIVDTLWCLRAVQDHQRHEPTMRLYAVHCARQVQHLMTDPLSVAALDVAERFARGHASAAELEVAHKAACAAAAADAARAAAYAAEADAARAAVYAAVYAAAHAATGGAQVSELRRVLDAIDAGVEPYPATTDDYYQVT